MAAERMRLRKHVYEPVSGVDGSDDTSSTPVYSNTHHTTLQTLRKPLLLFCIGLVCVFTLVMLVSSFDKAVHLSHSDNQWVHQLLSTEITAHNTYTIRMNTFRRNQRLKKAVHHFVQCERVHEIQVIWSDLENSPPDPDTFFTPFAASKTKFEVHDKDSLNNRFDAQLPIETEAVFSVDDDLFISCNTLDAAFLAWKSAPETLVGFGARAALQQQDGSFRYGTQWWTWWNGWYNIVLTKACFMHRKYVQGVYMKVISDEFRTYVDEHRNCEDLAMQFAVSAVSKAPPLWVKGYMEDFGGDGISSAGNAHFEHRSGCIEILVDTVFGGRNPLLFTNAFVLSGSDGWSHYLS